MKFLLILIACLAVHATGFALRGNFSDRGRVPLFEANIFYDGRPAEILVDNLGGDEDLKFQTGDPVANVPPFIGAFGEVKEAKGIMSNYKIFCTASLIGASTVLTAAHCIHEETDPNVHEIYVHSLSDVRIRSTEEFDRKLKNFAFISSVKVHDGWNREKIINDIAVAKLVKPLDAPGVAPICLGEVNEQDERVFGAGWGMKDCWTNSHETLRSAHAIIFPHKQCQHVMGVEDQKICSWFERDDGEMAAAAPGDSGGPLFSFANPNQPVQIGIASYVSMDYGPGGRENPSQYCTMKDIPQVYVRVSYFKSFIKKEASDVKWC